VAKSKKRAARGKKLVYRKPPPEGVVELVGVLGIGDSLVELKDGRLLSNDGRVSRNGGRTWTNPRSFGRGIAGSGILRLKSGKLCLTDGTRLWLSSNEGKTWGKARPIRTLGSPLYATLTQLRNGRLLAPNRACFGNMNHVGLTYEEDVAFGRWRGERLTIEGHGHLPEVSIASVSCSDDEGKTWRVGRPGEDAQGLAYTSATLMGWFGTDGAPTTGDGWVTDCDEPCVAETAKGEVLFFARSTVGRVVQSVSRDRGVTWTPVAPTDLAGSYAPARLVRIPKTGDLMCVWNQVSNEENRRGYRRGRLSAAISRDGGLTWGRFKTIELSEGLEDVARVQTERIEMVVRSRKEVLLPDNWAYFHYPNACFAADNVYIMYSRGGPLLGIAERDLNKQEQVLRIYPLEWFYS